MNNFEKGQDPKEAIGIGVRPIKIIKYSVQVIIESPNYADDKFDMGLRRKRYDKEVVKLMQLSEIPYKKFLKMLSTETAEEKKKIIEAVESSDNPKKIAILSFGDSEAVQYYREQNNEDYKEVYVKFRIYTEDSLDLPKKDEIKAVDYLGEIILIRTGICKLVK